MTTIDQTSTLSRDVEHDETQGGTDGNPHTESASMADLEDVGGGFEYEQPDDTTFNIIL